MHELAHCPVTQFPPRSARLSPASLVSNARKEVAAEPALPRALQIALPTRAITLRAQRDTHKNSLQVWTLLPSTEASAGQTPSALVAFRSRGPRLGAGPVGGSVGSRLPAAEASPWGPWPSHPQVKHLLRPAWHIRGPPWGDVSPGTSGRHTEQQPLRSAVCPVHREGNRGSCLWKVVPAGCGRTSSGRTSQSPEPPARRPPPLPGGPCLGDSQKPQLSGISRPGPGSAPLPRSPLRVPPPEPGLCREPHWPAEGSGNELVSGQPRVTVREGKSPPLPGPRSPPGRLFFTWWPPRSPLLQALA